MNYWRIFSLMMVLRNVIISNLGSVFHEHILLVLGRFGFPLEHGIIKSIGHGGQVYLGGSTDHVCLINSSQGNSVDLVRTYGGLLSGGRMVNSANVGRSQLAGDC